MLLLMIWSASFFHAPGWTGPRETRPVFRVHFYAVYLRAPVTFTPHRRERSFLQFMGPVKEAFPIT
jgi:hypothetical protein